MTTGGDMSIDQQKSAERERPDVASSADEPDASQLCMSADEALQRLREGQTLNNVRIPRLVLKGEFDKPITMKHCTLARLHIEKATFTESVTIVGCDLSAPRFGKKAVFEKDLNLAGSRFDRSNIHDIVVHGQFRCGNVTCSGKWHVARSEFRGPVWFWEARFEGWVNFKDCRFEDKADLRSLHATEGFSVTDCTFASDLLLRGATVEKKLDLGASRVEGLIDVSKAKFHDFVYLEEIDQGPNQRFAFANAVAQRILLTPAQIDGRLASENAGDYVVAQREYGLLKSVYQELHRYDDEDWAYYRFKVNERLSKDRRWSRPWTKVMESMNWFFLDLGCGYGTNPFRAVGMAVALMMLFMVLYAGGFQKFDNQVALVGDTPTSLPNRLAFGCVTSISVFTAGFTGDHLYNATGWMLVPLATEALLGTLLWGFFIVAFSRKVIR